MYIYIIYIKSKSNFAQKYHACHINLHSPSIMCALVVR